MKKLFSIFFCLSILATCNTVSIAQSSTPFTPPWSYTGVNTATYTVINAVQPYKKIVTRITQSSTSAPVDTTLEDNQSIAHTNHYISPGNYRIKATAAFSTTKTVILANPTTANCIIRAWVISADSIGIQTTDTSGALTNAKLTNTPFEIRMYP